MIYKIGILCLAMIGPLIGQEIAGPEVISKSINYHDPKGILHDHEVTMQFLETRPNGPDRHTTIVFNESKEFFQMSRSGSPSVLMEKNQGEYRFELDHQSELSDAQMEEHRLTSERLDLMHHYYRYLWLLPGTLKDPGTIVQDQVESVEFNNRRALEVKVTYVQSVGKDIWYFYFDPSSYALQGYRFYHDEAANDGEYIYLEGELKEGKLRIPATRKWYTHQADKLLGTDQIINLSFK